MKFGNVFCVEKGTMMSPYQARDIFFDQSSPFYQRELEFRCPDKACRARLSPVNVYTARRLRRSLHFRTANGETHSDRCTYRVEDHPLVAGTPRTTDDYKKSTLPDEFVIDGLRSSTSTARRSNQEEHDSGRSISAHRTNSLEHIVDCFLNIDIEKLKEHWMRIGSQRKLFYRWFKKVQYFHDGHGLIYYGTVQNVRQYGPNFRIRFSKRAPFCGKHLPVTIYITAEQIGSFSKSELFTKMLSEMVNAKEGEVTCFFVGAFPERRTVTTSGSFDVFRRL